MRIFHLYKKNEYLHNWNSSPCNNHSFTFHNTRSYLVYGSHRRGPCLLTFWLIWLANTKIIVDSFSLASNIRSALIQIVVMDALYHAWPLKMMPKWILIQNFACTVCVCILRSQHVSYSETRQASTATVVKYKISACTCKLVSYWGDAPLTLNNQIALIVAMQCLLAQYLFS